MGIGKALIIIGVLFILAGLFYMAGGRLTFLGICPGISIFPEEIRSFISL